MKKFLIIILLFPVISFAQLKTKEQRQAELDRKKAGIKEVEEVAIEKTGYDTKFCLIMASSKLFSKAVDISIDYGQKTTFFESTKIRDKNGNVIAFNSVIDALNYMYSLGWEFVNAYAITVGDQNVYHYLLRAKDNVTEDFIPKTKKDFK